MRYSILLVMLIMVPLVQGVGYVPTSVHGFIENAGSATLYLTALRHGTDEALFSAEPIQSFTNGEFVQVVTTDPVDGAVDLEVRMVSDRGEELTTKIESVPAFAIVELNFTFTPPASPPDEGGDEGSSGGMVGAAAVVSDNPPDSSLEDAFLEEYEDEMTEAAVENKTSRKFEKGFEDYVEEKEKQQESPAEPELPGENEPASWMDYALIGMAALVALTIMAIGLIALFGKKEKKDEEPPVQL